MTGFRFHQYIPDNSGDTPFNRLLKIFLGLMVHTSGDLDEALNRMNVPDRKYQLTSDDYGMGDFIEDMKRQGYIREDEPGSGSMLLTGKAEQTIRQRLLEEIFG